MKNTNQLNQEPSVQFKSNWRINSISALSLLMLLLALTALAQWQLRSNGLSTPQLGLFDMTAPDTRNCYSTVYDQNDYYRPLKTVVYTHDGGNTWSVATIDSLEDNVLMDITASSGKVVHVIGWSTISGGGNIFRSKDGGVTWKREAANAYTDPASFPTNMVFFNPREGVIFGDPVGGCFEIYRTTNGGDSWTRVPCANIPSAVLTMEGGLTNLMDNYQNTVWAFTVGLDQNGSFASRLLKSDDKGLHWYVVCPNMALDFTDSRLRFRSKLVGLYKNNGKLFRTTDGGATWNQVNCIGTRFSCDFDNVPGRPGVWISTGGDLATPPFSASGLGSSISYDDGDTWQILDTAVEHVGIEMVTSAFGFGGGITSGNGNDGAFVYSIANNKKVTADIASGSDLYAYPNPSNGQFTLKMKSMDVEALLEIYFMDGRLVYSQIVPANSISTHIDLQQPAAGLYQVRLVSGVEVTGCKLIVH